MLIAAAGGPAAGGAFWFSVSFSAVFLLNTLHPIAYAIIFREKGLGSALYIKEEDAPALYEMKDNDDTPTDSASQRVSTPSSAVMRPVADDNNVDNAPSKATPSKFSSAHICNRLADYCLTLLINIMFCRRPGPGLLFGLWKGPQRLCVLR